MVSRFKRIPSFAGRLENARKFTLYFSQKGRDYAQGKKKRAAKRITGFAARVEEVKMY
jgi:hypothetical protein